MTNGLNRGVIEYMLSFKGYLRDIVCQEFANTVRVSVSSPADIHIFSFKTFLFLEYNIDNIEQAGCVSFENGNYELIKNCMAKVVNMKLAETGGTHFYKTFKDGIILL